MKRWGWLRWRRRTSTKMAQMKPELTDERLEWLAERFESLKIREFTRADFGDYVADPEWHESIADLLARGGSVAWSPTRPGWLFVLDGRPSLVRIPGVMRCMS